MVVKSLRRLLSLDFCRFDFKFVGKSVKRRSRMCVVNIVREPASMHSLIAQSFGFRHDTVLCNRRERAQPLFWGQAYLSAAGAWRFAVPAMRHLTPQPDTNTKGYFVAVTATLAPAIDAYTSDFLYCVNIGNANTSTTPTLNLNGLGAKTVTRIDGSALIAGDLHGRHLFAYDSTKSSRSQSAKDHSGRH